MKRIEELEHLYLHYQLGCPSLENHVKWALECLERQEDENDYAIAILASSSESSEIVEYTRNILVKNGSTAILEIERDQLLNMIYKEFPLEPIPYPVTNYVEHDPRDYDGEGQSVADYFREKRWTETDLKDQGGYHLTYLNVKALVYYLPAFLLLVLLNKKPNTDILERFYLFLGEAKAREVIGKLNREQKTVLVHVLRIDVPFRNNDSSICRNIKELLKC